MEFVSLNEIVTDLLLIIRGSKVANTEKVSKRQIEAWVHQYRAMLIRNEVSSGDTINPDYIQTIPSIELVPVDVSTNSIVTTGSNIYRTSKRIPKLINLRQQSGLTFIGTITNKTIQQVGVNRYEFQLYKKFTSAKTLAYLEDGYIYIINPLGLKYIKIKGAFENPAEAYEFYDDSRPKTNFTIDTEYPIPVNMLPALKQLILEREIGIEAVAPGDLINDSAHRLEA